MSLELQNLFHALHLSEQNVQHILAALNIADVQQLNQALDAAVQLRTTMTMPYLYLLQQSQQIPAISYAVAPLLCSTLNYHTHYIAQTENWLTDFYQQYFRIDALETAKVQTMQTMHICLDLQENTLNATEFYVTSLLQALLDAKAKTIVTLGSQQMIAELKQQFTAYYAVDMIEISQKMTHVQLSGDELKKLFWKRKDNRLTQASQHIATDNSYLVAKLCDLCRTDAERFIEDLMYGEHVFEKVSVLGEFSDTIYKHEREKMHKLSA